jgi:hypothetical protein
MWCINDEGACKRKLKCSKVVGLRTVGEYLHKAGCNLKNKTSKM